MIIVIQKYIYYHEIIEYNQDYCRTRCYDYVLISVDKDPCEVIEEFIGQYDYIVFLNQPIKIFDDLFNCTQPTVYYLNYINQIIVLPDKDLMSEFLDDWKKENPNIYFIRKYIEL